MKRFCPVLASLLLFVSLLSACGGSADTSAQTDEAFPAEAPAVFAAGTVTDQTYSSEFAQFSFTLPENWVFATPEEAVSFLGVAEDLLCVPGQSYEDFSYLYDLVAGERLTNASSLFVAFENVSGYFGGADMTEDEYAGAFWTAATSSDTDGFYNGVELRSGSATLAGQTWTARYLDLSSYGSYQAFYFRKLGTVFCSITYTCTGEFDEPAFLGQFSPIA